MPAKYVPTEEELKNIMNVYAECKSYAGTARQIGLSTPVIKRIIDENKTNVPKPVESKPVKIAFYNGTDIIIEPSAKQSLDFNKEIKELYEAVIKNAGAL